MDTSDLVRLESMARAMPVHELQMHQCECDYGMIYFAYGASNDRAIHGIWAINGIGRTLEFKPDTKIEMVRQALVDDAVGFMELCYAKRYFHA